MKLLIASDIHGSARFSEMLLEDIQREDPDKILLLGDLLYHGPRNALPDDYDTRRTAEILNSLKSRICAVRGNCDAEVDQVMLRFSIMNTSEILEADGLRIFATHGHHYDPLNPPPFAEFDIMATGHTHIPVMKRYENFIHVNPGSVSIPKGGSSNSFMLLENGTFTLKELGTDRILSSMEI